MCFGIIFWANLNYIRLNIKGFEEEFPYETAIRGEIWLRSL